MREKVAFFSTSKTIADIIYTSEQVGGILKCYIKNIGAKKSGKRRL